jgi:uncharacterized cupredoxin-like copper-binding protein
MAARAVGAKLALIPTGRSTMSIKSLLIMPLVILAVPVASGCGGGDNKDDSGKAAAPAATSTQPATQGAGASGALTVRMTEFAFDPKDAAAKAGTVTISAPNDGKVVHELVVLKTNADPAKLPMDGNEVDESTSVGEIPDVEPGATKKVTLKLAAGKYAMVCNLPGHYQGGMYGSLTVK